MVGKALIVGIGLSFTPALASAGPLPFGERPPSWNGGSGGQTCEPAISYDATTLLFEMSTSCGSHDGLSVQNGEGGFDRYSLDYQATTLRAFIDNQGTVLSGSFSWVAEIPELGMTEPGLLGYGTVLDVLYLNPDNVPELPWRWGHFEAVMEFEYLDSAFLGLGPIIQWISYSVGPGTTCLAGIDEDKCDIWANDFFTATSWTGTQFEYYDRSVLIHEPSSFALFMLGLITMIWSSTREKYKRLQLS